VVAGGDLDELGGGVDSQLLHEAVLVERHGARRDAERELISFMARPSATKRGISRSRGDTRSTGEPAGGGEGNARTSPPAIRGVR
jgi:hypothetical protein